MSQSSLTATIGEILSLQNKITDMVNNTNTMLEKKIEEESKMDSHKYVYQSIADLKRSMKGLFVRTAGDGNLHGRDYSTSIDLTEVKFDGKVFTSKEGFCAKVICEWINFDDYLLSVGDRVLRSSGISLQYYNEKNKCFRVEENNLFPVDSVCIIQSRDGKSFLAEKIIK